ncbi:MAG: MFS transporter [Pseudomonadales bacterium]|nr:MFS transporter [Pseudomonadales bacterium]
MSRKLQRNIKIIHALTFFHTFMLIVPVIVPFFRAKGLTLTEIFYLQAIFAASIVLLEAPSGYLADLMGRRLVLLIGSAAHGLGYFWLNFAEGFWELMLFEITLGVAMSMLSGADLALLLDTENALAQKEQEHGNSLAQMGFTRSMAEGLGALLGGLLALWSFELMVLIQSLVAWVCLLLALMLVEPPRLSGQETEQLLSLKTIYTHLLLKDKLLRQVFIAIPVYNLATFHVAWLIQAYWENVGISLGLFGILWFAQSVTVGMANRFAYALERKKGAAFALLLIGVLPIFGHFGMAWLGGWFGIVLCFSLFFCRGLYQVILVNALNNRVPGSFRATANSLTSLLFRFGFILTGPLVGYLTEQYGMALTLNLLGMALVILFVTIMLPLVKTVRLLPRVSSKAA